VRGPTLSADFIHCFQFLSLAKTRIAHFLKSIHCFLCICIVNIHGTEAPRNHFNSLHRINVDGGGGVRVGTVGHVGSCALDRQQPGGLEAQVHEPDDEVVENRLILHMHAVALGITVHDAVVLGFDGLLEFQDLVQLAQHWLLGVGHV